MKVELWNNCLYWGKFKWNEVVIIKYPEWALFHIDCCEKFPDDKVYNKWDEGWMVTEWTPNLIITNE